MPGSELARIGAQVPGDAVIPAGARVLTPFQVPSRDHSAPHAGPATVRFNAPNIIAAVVADPKLHTAYAAFSGDDQDDVEVFWADGMWNIEWPDQGGSFFTVNGDAYGVQFGNGNVQFNTWQNGRHQTVTINGGNGANASRLYLYVPSGSTLIAECRNGEVTARATDERSGLAAIMMDGSNASLATHCAVGSINGDASNGSLTANGPTGPVDFTASNGTIIVRRALGSVNAKASNGTVVVHALESIMVRAKASNGTVSITEAPGAHVSGSASASNGTVTAPPGVRTR